MLLIFNAPHIIDNIEKTIGIDWLSESVINFKEKFDDTVTNFPTKTELENTYDKAYSWALEYKEKFELWVDRTHETIDNIRDWLEKAEDTYNTVKDSYEKTQQAIEESKKRLEETRKVIENIQSLQNISWSWEVFTWSTNTWSLDTNSWSITNTWTINE
jgi:predicted  nucleic acid-binding Zn-ribbon protein